MNIFVGNLSYEVTNEYLHKLFSEFGEVKSAKVIMDEHAKRSRGFGFVEMTETLDAELAIAKLHNFNLHYRPMVVKQARLPETLHK